MEKSLGQLLWECEYPSYSWERVSRGRAQELEDADAQLLTHAVRAAEKGESK